MRHEEYILQERIASLRQQFSDDNLAFLPDYDSRIAVLEELSFIDGESRVQLKGRVACEVSCQGLLQAEAILNLLLQINSTNELVLTELVLENVFAEYEPDEICALLSAFVFQEKTDVVPTVTPRLEAVSLNRIPYGMSTKIRISVGESQNYRDCEESQPHSRKTSGCSFS